MSPLASRFARSRYLRKSMYCRHMLQFCLFCLPNAKKITSTFPLHTTCVHMYTYTLSASKSIIVIFRDFSLTVLHSCFALFLLSVPCLVTMLCCAFTVMSVPAVFLLYRPQSFSWHAAHGRSKFNNCQAISKEMQCSGYTGSLYWAFGISDANKICYLQNWSNPARLH